MFQTAADWLHEHLWNTLLKKIITCVIAALLAVGAYGLVSRLTEQAGSCADGVTKSGGECVGVNGSGYDFGEPQIAPVAARIAEENRRIDKQPHVTVAMMLPLQPESKAERQQLRSELQGAFLAQYRANREPGKPVVRLVLANPGKDYLRQDEVVPELVRMSRSGSDNLRAVTGFNLSLDATKKAVRSLTEQQVPVLVARASASSLANGESKDGTYDFKGLARIIPTNEQQARALAAYNGSRKDRQTVLVRDTRPDPYVRSLARAFQKLPEDGPAGPDDMTFTSPGVADPGDVDNQFRPTVNTICNSGADTVYFAGRSTHLRLFLKSLAKEACAERKFTVVSGSDAASLNNRMTDEDWAELRDGSGKPRLTVQYAAPAHPDAWSAEVSKWQADEEKRTGKKPPGSKAPGSLRDPLDELARLEKTVAALKAAGRDIGDVELGDSRTMMVHDGVRTAVEAIRGAKPTGEAAPSAEQVGNRWATMQSKNRVNGTSGRICLTKAGNPYDKPLAVVELKPGTKAGPGTLDFVGLAWPTGKRQPEDCVVRGE
ncbi:amino acid ABC transporter substrate-binding protein [Streptomyces sp. NPDC056486]|uniref:ABC transporter substrate-binding protein n=1 Tax=Streptomyces sp. NPDC056486 TaxID=3345835 RepID=UPI0036C92E65